MTQEYVASAKQIVVLVSDNRRIQQINDPSRLVILGGIDAGIVAQNINLFCAANGLIVVTRGYMDSDAVAKGLNLEKGMHPMLNMPLGYR
jgi:nitroreductase